MTFFHRSAQLPFLALIATVLALPGCSTKAKRPVTPEQELVASRPAPSFSDLGMGRERVFGPSSATPEWILLDDGSLKMALPKGAIPETKKLIEPTRRRGSIPLATETRNTQAKTSAPPKPKKKNASQAKKSVAPSKVSAPSKPVSRHAAALSPAPAPKAAPVKSHARRKETSADPTPWLDKDFQWAPGTQEKRDDPEAADHDATTPKDEPH